LVLSPLSVFSRFKHTSASSTGRVSNRKKEWAFYIIGVAFIMLGLSYVSVPLYQLFCQPIKAVQPNEKLELFHQNQQTSSEDLLSTNSVLYADLSSSGDAKTLSSDPWPKPLTIYFEANASYPWSFKPSLQKIKAYPGDATLTFYVAQNLSDQAITGVSTYHVAPAKAGVYFNKIQCFCFEEQRLKSNETVELPILFFIDPNFSKDPKMKDIESLVLSYSFYQTS
jgi:cytochrome c oxidase assembly protein subunit 11